MRILAIDTALGACSAAVKDHDKLSVEFTEMRKGHAEFLMGQITRVMDRAGLAHSDLDRLAVTIGPGTFTGLRVGLSAAKGLALASEKPLVGISTLKAVAANISSPEGDIAVAFDARRGEVYCQLFSSTLMELMEPKILPLEQAIKMYSDARKSARVIAIGTGKNLIAEALGAEICEEGDLPRADIVAELAAKIKDPAAAPPKPLYLRQPDAKLPGPGPLEIAFGATRGREG